MMTDNDTWVKPLKPTLSSKGTLWEEVLYMHGWNDLASKDQKGIVVNIQDTIYNIPVIDVYWPALNLTTDNIFVDEILPEKDND